MAPPLVAPAGFMQRVEQAFAPLDGFPRIERLQAALHRAEPPAIDLAWSAKVPPDFAAVAADWVGAKPASIARGEVHSGRGLTAQTELQFRPVPLTGMRTLDLSEAAPVAVVAVLAARPNEVERDRLRELASQSRGLPLVLLAPEPIADDLAAELSQMMDMRALTGMDALRGAELAATLGPAAPDALRSAAHLVTMRRLLFAAQHLLMRALRRCEGEAMRTQTAAAGHVVGDPFAETSSEMAMLRPTLSGSFERSFKDVADAFTASDLPESELVVSHDGRAHQTVYSASDGWIVDLRARIEVAATGALDASMEFADKRVQALGERVRTAARNAGRERPVPVPMLSRAEMTATVKERATTVYVEPERTPERTLRSYISRHNPLGVIQPLIPAIGLAGLVLPANLFDKADAAKTRQMIAAVVMGLGALFYFVSILKAAPQRRAAMRDDREESRRKLYEKATAAARKALSEMSVQAREQVTRRSETVKVWFDEIAGVGIQRLPLANPHATRDAALRIRHKALAMRLKDIAELLKVAP